VLRVSQGCLARQQGASPPDIVQIDPQNGNPHGNRHRTRHLLNQEFMQALPLNFRHQGKKAIEKVARNQPGVYLKILALLVPCETKVEHSGGVKAMTDEQIKQAIEAIQTMLAARAGEARKVIGVDRDPLEVPRAFGEAIFGQIVGVA
jgi:hypothetical protein